MPVDELLDEDFHASRRAPIGAPLIVPALAVPMLPETACSILNRRLRQRQRRGRGGATADWLGCRAALLYSCRHGHRTSNSRSASAPRWASSPRWRCGKCSRRAAPWCVGRARRWPSNLGILVLDALLVRLLVPTAAVGVAVIAAQRGWGLLNITPLPRLAVAGFVAGSWRSISRSTSSMSRFTKCRCCGGCTACTTPISTSTSPPGVRFHPIEILLSLLIKIAVVLLVGVPAVAVVVFEVVLNVTSMFNHSNVSMPALARPGRAASSW